ncbi:M20/M25/M40 family metallo-hydrolase [Altererythrobacter sp. MF3-039]|uniref:M20/M25/M40 family metallo-hydrolase n=1 Tax=Altererythrobacter sp. MF3-039 TaxID=3252901 RepID=UPI00390C4B8A
MTTAAHEAEPSVERLEADMQVLAHDSLEGREAGTQGYDVAAGYVAGHFAAIGLQTSANGTYFQSIPFASYRSAGDEANTLNIDGIAGIGGLVAVEDYSASGTPRMTDGAIEGELVFVGFGFAGSGYERDDFLGVDLDGKIAVTLGGAPKGLNTEESAHFGSTQGQRLSERGAIGAISLWSPAREERFSWEAAKEVLSSHSTSMAWIGPDGAVHSSAPNLKASAIVSPAVSEALFAGQPVSWEQVVAAEADPSLPLPGFEMGARARITFANEIETTSSPNVIGVLPGSDPKLAHEVVVVTAHLDHVGIQPTEEEGDDEIFNGAMDNASGTVAIMEVARLLVEEPPRRTVLFLALTAEEKGLRGSDYFARYPVLEEGQKLVANVNLDMPVLTYEFSDVVAFGAERSTMLPAVQKAVKDAGLTLTPDPLPEEGYFTRSDQYSFVRQGIPAVYLDTGFGNGGDVAVPEFVREHYHKPSDEAHRIDYTQLARFTAVNVQVVKGIANMDETPKWKKGDFFGTTFGGPMED